MNNEKFLRGKDNRRLAGLEADFLGTWMTWIRRIIRDWQLLIILFLMFDSLLENY